MQRWTLGMYLASKKNPLSELLFLLQYGQASPIFRERITEELGKIATDCRRIAINYLLEVINEERKWSAFGVSERDYRRVCAEQFVEENLCFTLGGKLEQFCNALLTVRKNLESGAAKEDFSEVDRQRYALEQLLEDFRLLAVNPTAVWGYFKAAAGFSYQKRFFNFGDFLAWLFTRTWLEIKAAGVERIPCRGPCIIAPQHISARIDPILLYAAIPRRIFFMASVETFTASRILGEFFYGLGALPVKRDAKRFPVAGKRTRTHGSRQEFAFCNTRSISTVMTHLRCGDAVVIFPEGEAAWQQKKRPSNQSQSLQDGCLRIAYMSQKQTGVPVSIVPVGIDYKGGIRKLATIRIGATRNIDPHLLHIEHHTAKAALHAQSQTLFDDLNKFT